MRWLRSVWEIGRGGEDGCRRCSAQTSQTGRNRNGPDTSLHQLVVGWVGIVRGRCFFNLIVNLSWKRCGAHGEKCIRCLCIREILNIHLAIQVGQVKVGVIGLGVKQHRVATAVKWRCYAIWEGVEWFLVGWRRSSCRRRSWQRRLIYAVCSCRLVHGDFWLRIRVRKPPINNSRYWKIVCAKYCRN